MKKCIKCEPVETVNGYLICREEDKKVDPITLEPYGRTYVFYTVNSDDMMIESFKTITAARKYAKEN